MKIAHILWEGGFGGAERFAHDLAIKQRSSGHDVHLWITHKNGWFGEDAERQGVPVKNFRLRSGRDVCGLIRLTHKLRHQSYDIIHVHTGTPLFDFWAISLRPAQYVRHFHGILASRRFFVRLMDQAWNFLCERFIHLNLFNSTDTFEGVKSERNLRIHAGYVVPCGINVDDYRRDSATGQRIRKELGIPSDAFVVGGLGRLCPQKGFDDFIHAAMKIKETVRNVFFVLAGDGVSRAELEVMVKDAGLSEIFRFLGLRDDVPSLLSAFDCLMITSRWEPFGIVCLEGLAADCPVITYDIDGVHEAGGTAVMYATPRDTAQLAAHVLELSQNSSVRVALLDKGRKQVQHFRISEISQRLIDLYVAG